MLNDLAELARPDRRIVVARELTKKFETFTVLNAEELASWSQSHEPRGEYVILVDQDPGEEAFNLSDKDQQWIRALCNAMPTSKAAAAAAKIIGANREDVYRWILSEKQNG